MLRANATDGVEQNSPTLIPERIIRRDRKVAHRDELATRRGRDAVDASDYGLRQLRQRHHHPATLPEERLLKREGRVGAHFLEIMSRAERLAGARDNDHPRILVSRDLSERLLEFGQQPL